MTNTPPTWAEYTKMQFELEQKIAVLKADCSKWKYQLQALRDQSARITWLENRVAELEKQVESI